jgi:Tfp pilus assembly protein PilW
MSLAEVTVAAGLALIGFLVALILYQAARDMFKKGEQALDQQQQVRLGFDQMVRDIRLAGFNHNPDGAKLRTDEQIEGAWDGALFLRADYDAEDTTGLATDPEEDIKGVFNIVSTGNDEIVGYVLRRPDGTGGAAVTINADVNSSTTATSTLYGTVATSPVHALPGHAEQLRRLVRLRGVHSDDPSGGQHQVGALPLLRPCGDPDHHASGGRRDGIGPCRTEGHCEGRGRVDRHDARSRSEVFR